MPPLPSFAPATEPTPLAAPRRAARGRRAEIHEPAPLLDHEVAWLFDAGPAWFVVDGELTDVYAACHAPYVPAQGIIPRRTWPWPDEPASSSALALREQTGEFVHVGPAELVGDFVVPSTADLRRIIEGLAALPDDPDDPAFASGELVAVEVHPEPAGLVDVELVDAEAELAAAWALDAGHPLVEARSHRRGRRDVKVRRGRRGRRFVSTDDGASRLWAVVVVGLVAFAAIIALMWASARFR